ncbi:TetR/AcrR family transcriptional regulator [uncultured Aquimarina sp.]|uniref:TetR/AcrR family transcriptional regulator n=1 Tax=uncultured Aquimarina sp. TaxID=575652 RepID=UPI00260802EB|nr:TetR/AcrR family transcriptional regulator [uncultured Aquimarina sp.]
MVRQTDTETQILEAAKKIFVQKGFAGARMQEIANEAKINKSMLHYYFRSKELLFEKIMTSYIEMTAPNFINAISGEGTIIEKIERLVSTHINTLLKNPHIPMFILHELSQGRKNMIVMMKQRLAVNNTLPVFMNQIIKEQEEGVLKQVLPHHLMLTVMSLIVFPFIAKPIFQNMLEIPDAFYNQIMEERKEIVMNFLKDALLK